MSDRSPSGLLQCIRRLMTPSLIASLTNYWEGVSSKLNKILGYGATWLGWCVAEFEVVWEAESIWVESIQSEFLALQSFQLPKTSLGSWNDWVGLSDRAMAMELAQRSG